MTYVRNAWYAAAWSGELADKPVARTILDDPIVLFRGESGAATALYDACPHRFAPLSLGRIRGDVLACGYHGLQFDRAGACVRNPHGKGVVPASLKVRAYPLAERYGLVWIWTGDAALADTTLLPSLPEFDDPAFSWVRGQLHVEANYMLVIDNLLDLTHVEFLHPFLASEGNSERVQFRAEQDGDRVSALYDASGEPISGLFRLLYDGPAKAGDFGAYIHWTAPTNLYLLNQLRIPDDPGAPDVRLPTMHLLTPETADTTHYFWAAGRDRCHDDEQVSGMLRFGVQHAFEHEDEPMIRAVRSRMRSNDLFAHKPALLPMDEAAVRARRILTQQIDREQARIAAAM